MPKAPSQIEPSARILCASTALPVSQTIGATRTAPLSIESEYVSELAKWGSAIAGIAIRKWCVRFTASPTPRL